LLFKATYLLTYLLIFNISGLYAQNEDANNWDIGAHVGPPVLKFNGNSSNYYPSWGKHVQGAAVDYQWSSTSGWNGSVSLISNWNLGDFNLKHAEPKDGTLQGGVPIVMQGSAKKEDFDVGISTLDMVLLRGHILGNIDIGSHKEMGGDVNLDGFLRASDLIELRKVVLLIHSGINQSNYYWRFIPSWRLFNPSFYYDFMVNPFTTGTPLFPPQEYPAYFETPLNTQVGPYDPDSKPCKISFSAVKPGDSNNSHTDINTAADFWDVTPTCSLDPLNNDDPNEDGYSEDPFYGFHVLYPIFPTENETFTVNSSTNCFDIQIKNNQTMDELIGFQAGITLPSGLTVQSVSFNGNALDSDSYNFSTSDNSLLFAWIDTSGVELDIPANSTVANVEVCVSSSVAGTISDHGSYLNEFVFDENSSTNTLDFTYTVVPINSPVGIDLGQTAQHVFLDLEEGGSYEIRVYSLSGQLFYQSMIQLTKGKNKLSSNLLPDNSSFINIRNDKVNRTFQIQNFK